MQNFFNKKFLLLILLWLSFSRVSFAQVGIDPQLQVPIEQAIQNSTLLKNSYLSNQKTLLDKSTAQGRRLPHVSVNALYGYVHSNINIDLPTQTLPLTGLNLFDGSQSLTTSSQVGLAGVHATQVLFSGMQITNGKKALDEKYKAEQLMTAASYANIVQDLIQTFDQLMLLDQVDTLLLDAEKRLNKEHLKIAKAIENGLAIPYDRDKLKLAMLALDSKKLATLANRELLYYKVAELTKMPLTALQAIKYQLTLLPLDSLDDSFDNRKELQALAASQQAYQYVLKKEKGAQLPQLLAFGSASYFNLFGSKTKIKDLPYLGDVQANANHLRLAPSFAVGLGLKWDILDGNLRKNNIAKAKLDLAINANTQADTRDKLELLQHKVQSDYRLANSNLAVGQQQVAIARNNLHMAEKQFAAGLIDVTERLAAENEFYIQSLNYYSQVVLQRSAALSVLNAKGNLYELK